MTTSKLLSLIAVSLFTAPVMAESPSWRSSNIQFLHGNQYELGPKTRESITVEHASSWRYGESYFFSNIFNRRDVGTEFYAEFYPRLNWTAVTGKPSPISLLDDFSVVAGINMGNLPRHDPFKAYLLGAGVKFHAPGMDFLRLDVMAFKSENTNTTGVQISPIWGMKFNLGQHRFWFKGFIEWQSADATGKKASLSAQPQLLLASYAMAAPPVAEIVSADEVEWGYLNPQRGDASPGAADLWGDRTKDGPTGMLVKFNAGFSSPPHIHNITYKGIVIEGLMHNDDPDVAEMWLPTGSYWKQPAGENHITAANAQNNLIYLEIDSGPYLVMPSAQAFDNGERPLNLHRDNMVWENNHDSHRLLAEGVESTFLWGNTNKAQLNGSLVKLPAGFQGEIVTSANEFKAIVIQGQIAYHTSQSDMERPLRAGSYFGSEGKFSHVLSVPDSREVILYIRTDDEYAIK
ncbi:MAG: hypothetical protein Kow0083_06510 [Methylophaga sp.]